MNGSRHWEPSLPKWEIENPNAEHPFFGRWNQERAPERIETPDFVPHNRKLTEQDVAVIQKIAVLGLLTPKQLAEVFEVHSSTISHAIQDLDLPHQNTLRTEKQKRVEQALNEGMSYRQIAREIGVASGTICKVSRLMKRAAELAA